MLIVTVFTGSAQPTFYHVEVFLAGELFLRIEASGLLEATQRTRPNRFPPESFGQFSTLLQDADLSDTCLGLILLLQGPHAIFPWLSLLQREAIGEFCEKYFHSGVLLKQNNF